MAVSIQYMDKTSNASSLLQREGFKGQRMVVVPRPLVRTALKNPVTNRFLVTDAGFFPHARRHGRTRQHGSGQHIVMLCTDGSGSVHLSGRNHRIERGDVIIIPAGTPHTYTADARNPWTIWWFHCVGPDAAELVTSAHHSAQGPVAHLRDSAQVASLISQIIDALDTTSTSGHIRASGAAWHAFTHIIATGRRAPGQQSDPVEQAVEHLRATSPQRTSVDELAAMVGLGVSQFAVLFKQQVGVPPLRYQNNLRMAKARELLDSTDLPVSVIASSCGFDDPLYFSRHFTKSHGESPSAYRRRTI